MRCGESCRWPDVMPPARVDGRASRGHPRRAAGGAGDAVLAARPARREVGGAPRGRGMGAQDQSAMGKSKTITAASSARVHPLGCAVDVAYAPNTATQTQLGVSHRRAGAA